MIDWTRVGALRVEMGAEDFDEVVHLFLEEVGDVVARLRTVSAPDNLAADLHFLRGSCLTLGFRQFSNLCQSAEALANDGSPEAVDLTGIVASYDASRRTFLQELPTAFVD